MKAGHLTQDLQMGRDLVSKRSPMRMKACSTKPVTGQELQVCWPDHFGALWCHSLSAVDITESRQLRKQPVTGASGSLPSLDLGGAGVGPQRTASQAQFFSTLV